MIYLVVYVHALAFPQAIPAGRISGRSQPTLTTGNLILRPRHVDDAPYIVAAFTDPETLKYQGRSIESEIEAHTWVKGMHNRWAAESGASWAIIESPSRRLMGQVGIRGVDLLNSFAEFSYWITSQNRGQGVAGHAVNEISRWAFEELGMKRLEIGHAISNIASCRVAEKTQLYSRGY